LYLERGRPLPSPAVNALGDALDAHVAIALEPPGGVRVATWTPDGKRVITLGRDGALRSWNPASGTQLAAHAEPAIPVCELVEISPDGSRIVTCGLDSATLWDAVKLTPISTVGGHSGAVRSATFTPDGRYVVTTDEHGGSQISRSDGMGGVDFSGGVSAAGISADSKLLVTRASDHELEVLDLATLRSVRRIHHDARIADAVVSPREPVVVVVDRDGGGEVYRIDGDGHRPLVASKMGLLSARFSSDGFYLASTGEDRTVRIYNGPFIATEPTEPFLPITIRPDGEVKSIDFSADHLRIVTASSAGIAQVWEASVGTKLEGFREVDDTATISARFSPDAHELLTTNERGTARIWHLDRGFDLAELSSVDGKHVSVAHAAIASHAHRAVTLHGDGPAQLWDTDTGARLGSVGRGGPWRAAAFVAGDDELALFGRGSNGVTLTVTGELGRQRSIFHAPVGELLSVAVSPDGRHVAAGGVDGKAQIWGLDGTAGPILSDGTAPIESLAYSRDGARIATFTSAGVLWDASTGARITSLSGGRSGHCAPSMTGEASMWGAFSPTDDMIVTACATGLISMRAFDGTLLGVVTNDYNGLYAVAFSPDGTLVATGHGDGSVRLWRVPELEKPVHTIPAHRHEVLSVAFLHDGSRIASSSGDGEARVFDVASEDLVLAIPPRAEGQGRLVVPSPDGSRLLVMTEFMTHLYAIADDDLVAIACDQLLAVETWPKISAARHDELARSCRELLARHPAPRHVR
jgi:WD40 repeat protein